MGSYLGENGEECLSEIFKMTPRRYLSYTKVSGIDTIFTPRDTTSISALQYKGVNLPPLGLLIRVYSLNKQTFATGFMKLENKGTGAFLLRLVYQRIHALTHSEDVNINNYYNYNI